MIITEEQRIALESNPRYQSLCKQYVKFIAQYIANQDGTAGQTGGLTPTMWARERFIAIGVTLHPNAQDYIEWTAQITMRLKGADIWIEADPVDPDENIQLQNSIDATIDGMLAAVPNTFEVATNDIYAIRATQIPF